MPKKRCQLSRDRFRYWIGLYTLEAYWPSLYFGKDQSYGISAKTILFWRPARDWKWNVAFALSVLGFGFGVAHNHCDNPNYDPDYRKAQL